MLAPDADNGPGGPNIVGYQHRVTTQGGCGHPAGRAGEVGGLAAQAGQGKMDDAWHTQHPTPLAR